MTRKGAGGSIHPWTSPSTWQMTRMGLALTWPLVVTLLLASMVLIALWIRAMIHDFLFQHSFLRKWAVTHDPFASRSRDLDNQARPFVRRYGSWNVSGSLGTARKTTLSDGSILKLPRGPKLFQVEGKPR